MTTTAPRIVVLDTETTGLDPSLGRLIEIAAVRLAADLTVEATFETLVDPCLALPLAVTRLTGLHDDDVCGAPGEAAALQALREFAGDALLVAHNAAFDREHLAAAARRGGQPELLNDWLDTLELATLLYPELDGHALSTLSRCLACERPAHRALQDAETTADLLVHLRRRAAELSPVERALLLSARWDPLQRLESLVSVASSDALDEDATPSSTANQPEPLDVDAEAWEGEFTAAADGGGLAARLPAFRPREGQLQLAAAAAQVFDGGGIGVFEAGTGSGKSLAYLLPAAFSSAATGRRVVVSTKTKVLQRQLAERELPIVSGALPDEWRWAVLMGRENYLCRHRLTSAIAAQDVLLADPDRSLALAYLSGRVRRGDVDLSGLPYGPSHRLPALPELAKELRSTRATCLGRHCTERRACLWRLARSRAEASHLICVNHALLLTAPGTLPSFDNVVIDEAHLLPQEATEAFTLRIAGSDVARISLELKQAGSRSLVRQLRAASRSAAPDDARVLTEAADYCIAGAAQVAEQALEVGLALYGVAGERAEDEEDAPSPPQDDYDLTIWLTPGLREYPSWERFATAAALLGETLTALAASTAAASAALPDDHGLQAPLRGLGDDADQAAAVLGEVDACANTERVLWVELPSRNGRGAMASASWAAMGWSLASAPLSPAPQLRARLWDNVRGAVLTSATLAVAGDFEYFRRSTGLLQSDLDVHERIFASPFDYRRQAALVVAECDRTPAGRDAAVGAQHGDQLQRLAAAARGRTLALFTNRRDLRRAAAVMDESAADDNVLVLAQGVHGSAAALAAEFRTNPETVLLGVDSLWTGQDFPGDALVCLVIARLPFPRQDAIFQARRRACELNGERWFEAFYLPEAVLKFRQGCGRLIRTETDYGVIVVLDERLTSRPYGRAFLASVPEYPVIRATDDNLAPTVEQLLAGLAPSQSPSG